MKRFPDEYGMIPESFVLPDEYESAIRAVAADPDQYWIAKPSSAARGMGIIFLNSPEKVPASSESYALSRYIDNPYLINGYKFDLRVYVVLTSINPLRIYVYEEGLCRFATVKYKRMSECRDEKARYTHLTNYSVNKKNANFIENKDAAEDDEGSKWSLNALWKHFRTAGIDPKEVKKKMDDVIIKTFISGEAKMNEAFQKIVKHQTNCFQIFGFDLLIDDALKVWLLEVNLSSSLCCDTPLDQKIKGNLVADTLTLSGIIHLDSRANHQPVPKFGQTYKPT